MKPYQQADWRATHKNGYIPHSELAEIPDDDDKDLPGPPLMHPEAAWNYQRMRDAAKEAGVNLAISYSYRTYDEQVERWEWYQNGGPNTAARPGTSNHGWGLALDLSLDTTDNPGFVWLKSNAIRFGFHNNDASNEPWHWDYEGGHPIEEDQMTPEEKAEFDELKKTVADHARLITALREGLGTPEDPAQFLWAGKRVAGAVRKSEAAKKEALDEDEPKKKRQTTPG